MLNPTGRNHVRSAAECQRVTWDAIIVGTGVGGATLGFGLAQAGKQVLFIEKGKDLDASDTRAIRGATVEALPEYSNADEDARGDLLARGGRASDRFLNESTGRSVLPEIGCGTGGSSAVFGMVLERFFPEDFTPRAHHKDADSSSLPETWPLGYRAFEPWYEKAERLFRVRGTADPLRPGNQGALLPPATLGRGASALFDRIAGRGLRPYRLPLSCESRPDCQSCQGYLCAKDCKNDANRVALRPAILQHGATLLSNCEAVGLIADRTRVRGVACRHEEGRMTLSGRMVILAGGALQTPRLLLASRSSDWETGVANSSGLVGRNLMRHGIDLWALLRAPRLHEPRDLKALGFNDLYLGTGSGKLGTVQSFGPWPPPEVVLRGRSPLWSLLGPLARVLWRSVSSICVLGSILED
jgi:choline dehydrogenase-like flavoprotein